jgi:hypothetical protein
MACQGVSGRHNRLLLLGIRLACLSRSVTEWPAVYAPNGLHGQSLDRIPGGEMALGPTSTIACRGGPQAIRASLEGGGSYLVQGMLLTSSLSVLHI